MMRDQNTMILLEKKSMESELDVIRDLKNSTEKWSEIFEKLGNFLPKDEFRKTLIEFFVEQMKEKAYLSMNHENFVKTIIIFKDVIRREYNSKK